MTIKWSKVNLDFRHLINSFLENKIGTNLSSFHGYDLLNTISKEVSSDNLNKFVPSSGNGFKLAHDKKVKSLAENFCDEALLRLKDPINYKSMLQKLLTKNIISSTVVNLAENTHILEKIQDIDHDKKHSKFERLFEKFHSLNNNQENLLSRKRK